LPHAPDSAIWPFAWLGPGAAPCGLVVGRERVAQRGGVLGAQVDLVAGAVQPEPDGSFCFAAVDVVQEQQLYFLRHARGSVLPCFNVTA